MDKFKQDELHKILNNIVEKYKDKPRLYPKMKLITERLEHCSPVKKEPYNELAKLTSKIHYDCGFTEGKCKAERSEMCCCDSCVRAVGHFRLRFFRVYDNIEYIERELLYYVRKYSNKTGFWRKGKGCILPRERRSITCLGYNCNQRFTKEEHLVVDLLRNYEHITKHQTPSYLKIIIHMLKDHFLYKVK